MVKNGILISWMDGFSRSVPNVHGNLISFSSLIRLYILTHTYSWLFAPPKNKPVWSKLVMQQHTEKNRNPWHQGHQASFKNWSSHLLSLINGQTLQKCWKINQLRFSDDSGWLVDWRLVDWLSENSILDIFCPILFYKHVSGFLFGIVFVFSDLRPGHVFGSGVWRFFSLTFQTSFLNTGQSACSNRATKRPSKNSSMISSCAARFSPLGAPAWVQHSKEDHPNYTKWFGSGEKRLATASNVYMSTKVNFSECALEFVKGNCGMKYALRGNSFV